VVCEFGPLSKWVLLLPIIIRLSLKCNAIAQVVIQWLPSVAARF
jgi:hypothetical protein